MWLIKTGKVLSVIYLVFACLFAYLHGIILLAERDDGHGHMMPAVTSSYIYLLIPVSWGIPWAAHRLRKRLFEDVNFDRSDWIYYRAIVIGSWSLYFLVCAIPMALNWIYFNM